MASGDKNYFRHSNKARNDDFIVFLMSKMREKGYFMWFALLELCSERVGDKEESPFVFNQSTLYKELRCTKHTLNLFLTYCEHMSKIGYTYVEPIYNIDIKNLNKFNGRYRKKDPNKIKLNKIKSNTINTSCNKRKKEMQKLSDAMPNNFSDIDFDIDLTSE